MNKLIKEQIQQTYSTLSKTNALYGKWAKKHGLNYNSLMVLYAIKNTNNCTQKHISEGWLIPKQTVNTILNDLKNKEYVVLDYTNNNKKEKIISFTETGETFSDSILSKLYIIEEHTMIQMGEEMSKQLVETNIKFCDIFEQELNNE